MNKKIISSLILGAMLAVTPATAFAETVTVDLGNPVINVDGSSYVMQDVAGLNEEGVILVPVRDIAEAFGGTVVYDAAENTVKLTFPNGNWANIAIGAPVDGAADDADADGIVSTGTFVNDRLYIPATLMATCLGARLELIDYGQDTVYRLIYHVR